MSLERRIEALEAELRALREERDEARAAQQATLRVLPRLRQMLENSSDIILLHDAEGVIIDCNRRAEELLGFPRLDFIGMSLATLDTEGQAHAWADEGRVIRRYRTASGEALPVDLGTRHYEVEGERFFVTAARDVRAHLTALKAAEAASRAKSRFLSNICHEVRTPVNGVVGLAEILLQTKLSRAQRRYAELMASSGQALVTLVNDLLDFSRMERGQVDLREAPFSPVHLTEEVARLLAPQATQHGVELVAVVSPEVPEAVEGDESRLRQVLTNLVGNAVKFTREGQIVLRLSARATEEGLRLHFDVEDTGPGVAEADRVRIFEAFSQGDERASRREHQGAGLGLAISRELCELMSGSIELRRSARGAHFAFDVLVSGALRSAPPPSRAPVRVEAEGAVAEMLRARLAALGHPEDEGAELRLVDLSPGGQPAPPRPGVIQVLPLGRGEVPRGRTVYKPVDTRALGAALATEDAATPEPELSANVLVVDDNPINRMVAVRLLQAMGVEVLEASGGAEAIEAVRAFEPCLVFMDCQMPGMDGYEATKRIRALVGAELPIIALTASALDLDRSRAMAAGMSAHLPKPVTSADLRRCLEEWLS